MRLEYSEQISALHQRNSVPEEIASRLQGQGTLIDWKLTEQVRAKTFHQVRNLTVEVRAGSVVVFGRTPSYYVKQLATHALVELVPGAVIDNSIEVAE